MGTVSSYYVQNMAGCGNITKKQLLFQRIKSFEKSQKIPIFIAIK